MRVLQYAVRLPVLIKYFGQLCIAFAVLTVVPLVVSLLCGDFSVSIRYVVVLVCTFSVGMAGSFANLPQRMQNNEAMVVTALIFLFSPLVMTWPVMASGFGFTDALFETISAVTTTGLSTATTLTGKSQTFLFSRAWMQWVGGLGIVVLSMATLIQPGLAAKRLDIADSFDDDIIGGTRAIAQRTFVVYSLLTIAGIVLLILLGVDWFTALLYVLAAISTGGFSPHDASLQGLDNGYGAGIVIVISMAGAISLTVYYRLFHGGWRNVVNDQQIKPFLTAAVLVTAVLSWLLWHQDGLSVSMAIRHGVLNGLSALSTAGFSTMNVGDMGSGSKLTLIVAMAVGGCAGSTAGGIKIIRMLIAFRLLYLIVQRAGAPAQAVLEGRLNGKKLRPDEIYNAVSIIVLFPIIIILSWLPFLVMGYAPLDSLFEVVSALGTAGISAGITSTELPVLLKGILGADMLLGRLEIIVWLIAFYPGTWFGLRKEK
ncbi:MAG: TrkH family potassium uptake protein [Desulforhopalus sp.]